jgi:hypothetical protein
VRLNNLKKSLEHGRMTSLSDTLTVGLVLVLLFGSIALYLYTRIQQAEQKISLLESILLDLKMSSEIKSYTELPAATSSRGAAPTEQNGGDYVPFDEDDDDDDSDNYYPGAVVNTTENVKNTSPAPSVSSKHSDEDEVADNEVEQYKSIVAEAVNEDKDEILPNASKVSVNYESMTLKELQNLAKSRGITGAGSMKKGAIIEALKTSDRSSNVEPGSSTLGAGSASFLETSAPFLGAAETQ